MPSDSDDGQKIVELERKIDDLTGALRDANRPAIQVIQRVEGRREKAREARPVARSGTVGVRDLHHPHLGRNVRRLHGGLIET